MDKLPLISIIVPVYNAEKYLNRCVESLIKQTYENIEIILVDDGSGDLSGKMCDEYAENTRHIRAIHQVNAGDSSARNAGIRIAKGEFVYFVDADDYIPYDSISQLVEEQRIQDADIVIGMVNAEPYDRKESIAMLSEDMAFFCIDQRQYLMEHDMPQFTSKINPGSQCMKIIRKSILIEHNVWFNEKVRMHHQDTLFSMNLYANANKIILLNAPVYNYDVDIPGSMRKKLNPNKLKEADTLIRSMRVIIEMYSIDSEQKQNLFREFYTNILYECWSEYFTHEDNKAIYSMRYQDLMVMRDYFQKFIPFPQMIKENRKSYPKYQQIILMLIFNQKFRILAIIAIIWSRHKGNRR